MIKSSDTYSPTTKELDSALQLLMKIMRRADDPGETVQDYLLADHDLDELYGPVLSEFAAQSKLPSHARMTERSR